VKNRKSNWQIYSVINRLVIFLFGIIVFNACSVPGKVKEYDTNSYFFIRNPGLNHKDYLTALPDSTIINKYELLYLNNNSGLLTDFRKPVRRPSIDQLDITESGRIEMMVCVDRTGNTTFVKVLPQNTSISDKISLKKAVNYLGSFTWENVNTPLKEECGKYRIIIENKS
jgi:hypothetical protein